MDRHTAKKQMIHFYILLVAFTVVTVIAVGSILAAHLIRNDAYKNLTQISSATTAEVRRQSYRQAISLWPEKTQAYLLLLETYSEDGIFSKNESEEFLAAYNSGHSHLKHNAEYTQLHAQAGLLYINAYTDTPTMRLRKALPFFEAAKQTTNPDAEDMVIIDCYASIGQYYREYIWAARTKEVSEQEMSELLADITKTLNALDADTAPDTTYNRLGFSAAVCNLIYDQRDVLSTTAPQENVFAILDRIYNTLPKESVLQVQRSKEIVRELSSNKEMYYDMLERAYERMEGYE